MVAASHFLQHCNLLYTLDIPGLKLKDNKILNYDPSGRFSDFVSLDCYPGKHIVRHILVRSAAFKRVKSDAFGLEFLHITQRECAQTYIITEPTDDQVYL